MPVPQLPAKLAYRPDIDGLRALAVLLVVFNHLQTLVTGGYVGVDVFFVISGYLISSGILSEMEAGTFSIGNFYERRVRRIFPALLVMLLVASLLAYRYLLPSETDSFAHSLLASLASVSNMFFWSQAGYFDPPSAFKPLLHTWSLAVEEQFYIIFPLFLIALRMWRWVSLKAAIWSVTILSFALACLLVSRAPSAAFFFAPLRAWELLVGTIMSQHYFPKIRGAGWRNLASLVGLFLVVAPAFLYTARTPVPGFSALPVCLGAALLIGAGETGSSVVGRLLSWRPVVFIGLISYSLYLCHWPIIVFRNRAFILSEHDILRPRDKIEILVVSMIAATISWRFVEIPFRKGMLRPGRRRLFLVNGLTAISISVVALIMILTHGLPSRFSNEAVAVAAFTDYHPEREWREGVCFLTPDYSFSDFQPRTCLSQDTARLNLLLFGDSLAAHLYPGIVMTFPKLNILQATAADCRPLLHEPVMQPPYDTNCYKMSSFIFGSYLMHHQVDAVLLAGNWHEALLPELGRTIAWIRQHDMVPIVVGPAIEYDTSLPRLLASSLRSKDYGAVDRHRVARAIKLDQEMEELARNQWNVRYISVFGDLCEAQIEMAAKTQKVILSDCPVYATPGVPMDFDEHHLTVAGSERFAMAMRARNQLP
jgi:peptidoglycan/LPS O-acetylase OafA/YrhL